MTKSHIRAAAAALGALVVVVALAATPAADSIPFQPFSIDYRDAGPSSLDLSSLLDAPAGAHGPLRVAGGHVVDANGRRFRLWGVNITTVAPGSVHFPAKEDAAFWADALARLGINCVRLHFFDTPAPKGILAAHRNDTQAFDPTELDRLDYFVAALKQRGIYTDLNLNVGRVYKPGDGVRDSELIGTGKALTYFDPRLIALQREYARALLTHYNPYTKSEYRNEPAIAIVEIVNENSLVNTWARGRLVGNKTHGPVENWQDITPYYATELTRLYNAWLERHLPAPALAALRQQAHVAPGQPVPRLAPAEFATAPRAQFHTEARFYMDVEHEFFASMRQFLKHTLGVKALLIGTSDYSYGKSFYPSLSAAATLDIVDTHGPWALDPMVDEPLNSIPVRISRSAVAGKPLTVTEHNARFPSDYMCEGIPLLAAYGAFQDWDGIFLYTFEMKQRGYVPYIGTRADLSHDPVKLANVAAGALLFLRGDVTPARQTVLRSYSAHQVMDSLTVPESADGIYFTPGFSPGITLEHGVRISSLDGAPTTPVAWTAPNPIVSDTHQLTWYHGRDGTVTQEDDQTFQRSAKFSHRGVVTVDTPRTQAVIGFVNARAVAPSMLSLHVQNPFASVVLSSLDGEPIATSRRMLLAATARVTNTGAEWNRAHTALVKWGGPPTQIEPVTGTIILHGLAAARSVQLVPLNGAGLPMTATTARQVGRDWELTVGAVPTTWYEVRVDRTSPTAAPHFTQYVNPFIGTAPADAREKGGGANYNGNTFPGADYPMGMVQWSPDTPGEKAVKSGYWYPDTVITGFPLTHFSGRGVTYLQDFPVLPVVKPVDVSPGTHWAAYGAAFAHEHEQAHPGYYAVTLDTGVRVELTATARTGFGRFAFPANASRTLLVRADSHIEVTGDREISGRHDTFIGGGKKPFTIYFVAQFDQPFARVATWSGDALASDRRQADGAACGAAVSFGGGADTAVQMKVGVSFTSLEGARRNLAQENPGWDFAATRAAADRAWEAMLSRIAVDGGSVTERRKFYTALYHCFFHPNLLNDVDGRYPGMDGKVHTATPGHAQYQNIPAWDQYRSFAALRAILTPRESADIAQSLVNFAQQDAAARPTGGGMPRWEQVNRNSGGMVGDGDDAIIATAYAFGARDFDAGGALAAMDKGASVPGTTSDGVLVRQGLQEYISLGYVPGRASVTQEYCIADFAVAQLAGALGDTAKQATYEKRAQNWRKLYNPATKYLEPRNADGSFPEDFDPSATKGFTEGSAAQYLWLVNFDFRGLVKLLGGSNAAISRLDALFTELDAPGHSMHIYLGNEVSEATPWAYNFADAPAKTQAMIRRIQHEIYFDTPGGLPGNDDAGALSSWYVFSALGLYPVVPGVAGFTVGSPVFRSAVITVPGRRPIRIEGEGAAADAPYVQSLSIDGNAWNRPWIPWAELSRGATVLFTLGRQASHWGSDAP